MNDYNELLDLRQRLEDIVNTAKTTGALIYRIGEVPEIRDYVLNGWKTSSIRKEGD